MNQMAKGREKGSGFKSQRLIIACLVKGPKSSTEIRQATMLSKNTVWSNLKHLKGVITTRSGRTIYYNLNGNLSSVMLKLLFFQTFLRTKQTFKILKWVNQTLELLVKAAQPIKQIYELIERHAKDFKELAKKVPELYENDVWNAIRWVKESKYVELLKKHRRTPPQNYTRVLP